METFLNKYNSLDKIMVYDFNLGYGGIGDLIKFFIYLLNFGIKNDIKIYYLINNIYIEKYLQLKYDKLYIKNEEIKEKIYLNNESELYTIQPNIYYMIKPHLFYNIFTYDTIIPYNSVFQFNDIIKLNCKDILESEINNYTSIHLRLGDKYLETDKKYVNCINDTREYNEDKLYNFIELNSNIKLLFFCDNYSYKLKIKEKYSNIIITSCDIAHTSFSNTTEKQVLDSVTEFYLLTKSDKIISVSKSGFSMTSSKFNNIELLTID
jgi:hypothetical protein